MPKKGWLYRTAMMLTDAQIDHYGKIVCTGSMDFPVSECETFDPPKTEKFVLSLSSSGCTLWAAKAVRNEKTGFLDTERIGQNVRFPELIASAIFSLCSNFGSKPAFDDLKFHGSGGALYREAEYSYTDREPCQSLSNWSLVVVERKDCLQLELSADLYDSREVVSWDDHAPEIRQYWSSGDDRKLRIVCCLQIDLSTLAVVFDHPSLMTSVQGPGRRMTPFDFDQPISLSRLSLADSGGFICRGDNYPHIGIHQFGTFQRVMYISRLYSVTRDAAGICRPSGRRDPDIAIDGFDLAFFAERLRHKNVTELTLQGERLGYVSWSMLRLRDAYVDGLPSPNVDFDKVRFRCALTRDGLKVDYSVHTTRYSGSFETGGLKWIDGTLTDGFLVPWEILIVRMPRLGKRWTEFIEGR